MATAHIVGFKRVGSGSYAGGPLSVEVAVENTGATAVTAIQVHLAVGISMLEQTVDIPAKTTKQIVFNDANGTDSGCSPHPYLLKLTGAAADPHEHHAKITPTCVFTTKVTDPWNLAEPDRVVDAKKNHVFATGVVVESGPTCASGLKLKAHVANASSKAGTSLILSARANQLTVAQSIAFALPAGGGKDVDASGAAVGVPEKIDLTLFDPTNNLTASIVNQGVSVTTTRACTLVATLEP